MSTKIKDSLHELIHAMTKTEKRYFKLHATRHSGNDDSNMILLFDFIIRQKTYNEVLLFEHFKGKAFLNQFSTVKKRLYDQLLQSLHLFHANASLEAQLGRMLHQASILYEKSLYDQSLRHLKSIEKIACRHEFFLIIVQSGKLKQRIMETKGYKVEEEMIAELNNELQHFLSKEQLIHKLWYIKSKLFRQMQSTGIAATSSIREKLNQLLLLLPKPATLAELESAEATYLYYHIQAAYHYANGDLNKSLNYAEQTIAHLQQHTIFSDEHPNILISALTNACYLAEKTGHFDKSTQFLQLLKATGKEQESLSEDLQIKLFSSISSIELSLLIIRGDFQTSVATMQSVHAGLEKYGSKIHPVRKAFFQLRFAVIHMGNEDFSAALKQINLILNDTQLSEKEEIITAAYLINVILHFELKNKHHLPYAIKITQRILKSHNRLHAFEMAFLQTMAKTTRTHELDFPELFATLDDQLKKLSKETDTAAMYVHFDLMTWVEAKVHQHSLARAIKDKYQLQASA